MIIKATKCNGILSCNVKPLFWARSVLTPYNGLWGGGHFTRFLVGGPALDEKMDSTGSKVFVRMRGQKDLRTVKRWVNKIEIQGENWYKMVQNGQMTDLCEKIDQL